MFQMYYVLHKVIKKEKYLQILLGNTYDDKIRTMHKQDLKNNKLCIRVVLVAFEKLLGKLSISQREDFMDCLLVHYAQNNENRDATLP